MTIEAGVLYVVATPIGHRDDITLRALAVLREVTTIFAEDTRHSGQLLSSYGINTPLQALHDHNETQRIDSVMNALQRGDSVALISDAGTPLISDPGYKLVQQLRERQLKVVPIPGASAIITALSAAGLATDRFSFEGFLPPKSAARRTRLEALKQRHETLVFYEAPHRIVECLVDMCASFADDRRAVLCRELTKTFETFLSGTLAQLVARVKADHDQQRGEMVILIEGAKEEELATDDVAMQNIIGILMAQQLSTRQVVEITEQITGLPHKKVYRAALDMKDP